MAPPMSLPANGTPARPPASAYDPRAVPTPAQEAVAGEQRGGYVAATVGLALQVVLFGLAGTAAVADRPDAQPWTLSMVLLTLLLCSGTMVALLLAVEAVASGLIEGGRRGAGTALVWAYRALTTTPLAAALWLALARRETTFTWRDGALVTAGLLVVSGVVVLVTARQFRPPRSTRTLELDEDLRTAAPTEDWDEPTDDLKIVAVGASGGGIRAASFVLGGHQALQAAAPELGIASRRGEPHVFAVSGGSYVAAALAMRRSFDPADGAPLARQERWTEAYAPDSVELERLRRHTRYLFEPRARTLDGAFTLVTGAMVNLFVATALLLTITWVSAQMAVTLGVLGRAKPGADLLDFWVSIEDHRVAVLLVPLALLAGVLGLTVAGWLGGAAFDDEAGGTVGTSDAGQRRRAEGLIRLSGTWRGPLTAIALGWLLLAVGIPVATTGVAEMATRNQPTASVARGLAAVGLVTPPMCSHAFAQSLDDAVEEVVVAAEANPGTERSVTAGACGAEYTVTWTDDGQTAAPTVAAADVTRLEAFANLDGGRPVGRVGAIIGLLLSVLGLLRRGPGPGQSSGAGRLAALRRRLLTVVPLTITAAIGVYVVLLSFRWLVDGGPADIAKTAAVVVAACAVSFLLDANGTSMHSFYRARIADAFSVGVREVQGRKVAQQLPTDAVYRYSDLRGPAVAEIEELDPKIRSERAENAQLLAAREAALAQTAAQVTVANQTLSVEAVGQQIREKARASVSLLRQRKELAGRFDAASGRLHIVATLNSQKANESATMRGGFPLVFGASEVRLFREGGLRVVKPMRGYENFAGPRRVSILSSVAISGAAISPLMGRYAEQMAPYRFLLALFNVRLGTWVRNPAHTPPDAELGGTRRTWLWMTSKPGLAQMVLESAGSSAAGRRWVYLSDGGHLDNTGMVEAVRHCALAGTRGRVLVLDASNDAEDSWQAVGDAVAVIRADLCLDLRRRTGPGHPPWLRLYVAEDADGRSLAEVLVVKAVRVAATPAEDPPADVRVTRRIRRARVVERHEPPPPTADWLSTLPPDVQSFQARHPDFPRASTGRQKFGDLEFEAYRAFGFATVTEGLRAVGWIG